VTDAKNTPITATIYKEKSHPLEAVIKPDKSKIESLLWK
jgi:hypothetical protein